MTERNRPQENPVMELPKSVLVERQFCDSPFFGLDGSPPLIKQLRKLPRRDRQSLGYFGF